MANQLREFTLEEVSKHNAEKDLWIVINSKVYDLSKFANMHPGGSGVLYDSQVAGKDVTDLFFSLHRQEVLAKSAYQRLIIGTVKGQQQRIIPRQPGDIKRIPYSEANWLAAGFFSPYFKESHRKFLHVARKFAEEVVFPDGEVNDPLDRMPSPSVIQAMAKNNIIAMRIGPGPHLKGRQLFGGLITPEEFDYFHEMILHQEMSNAATRGYNDGLLGGGVIGLPALVYYGSESLKAKYLADILDGKKHICLAISEAFAGSDVAGLRTTAKRTPDGKYFIVTGTKKWITNGHFADWFVTPCRTEKGLTVLLIPRTEEVTTKLIKTAYSSAAGTAHVFFDGVKVPVENVLGLENGGLVVILANFNHERWMMTAITVKIMRIVVEETFQWAHQRIVFGKPLLEQPVVRNKLAGMIARVETSQAWLENITYQMNHMPWKDQAKYLAGPIGLMKMQTTRSAQQIATDAVQIFGGRGITKTGLGRIIEGFHRTVPFDAILGGAEDVLGDLGVRQAMKYFPKNTRL
ncbi:acyl-CoA dehydrogenase [Cantharellus anzutake]|uniref:acyl-CoA dehydrogenase n=1 Tax=Cantharellus anzutake TaxID=1750568 RepID=UPI0019085CF9|nr:acyl-CoA dehydrogenase [Cantharellus anzutake]KAF8325547.1 acyl-CoA dehydrogenase [Cantharellus anzutake]